MKLKSKKGLLITYVEVIILLFLILWAGSRRGYYIDLQSYIIVYIVPLLAIAIDTAFPTKKTFSIAAAVGLTGGVVMMLLLEDLGFLVSTLLGTIFFILFWLIFSQINKGLFTPKEEAQKQ